MRRSKHGDNYSRLQKWLFAMFIFGIHSKGVA